MGAGIVDKLAFPSSIPKTTYSNIPSSKLHEIAYENKKIYAAVYEPMVIPRLSVIYIHANAETLYFINYYMEYAANSFNCRFIAFDWAGYGQATGRQSTEADLYKGCDNVYAFCIRELGIQPRDLLFWGRSIGTVGATYLAQKHRDAAGVILQSPPASAFNTVFKQAKCTACDSLQSCERIGTIEVPICLIHGRRDTMIDIRNAELLFNCYLMQNSGNQEEQIISEENYFPGVQYKQFKKLQMFVIENGEHNNLDSVFKRQMSFIVRRMIEQVSCGAAE